MITEQSTGSKNIQEFLEPTRHGINYGLKNGNDGKGFCKATAPMLLMRY